jgi:hypothetical protein
MSARFASSPDSFAATVGDRPSPAPADGEVDGAGTSQGIKFFEDGTFERFFTHKVRGSDYKDDEPSGGCFFNMEGSYVITQTQGSITEDGFPGVGTVIKFTVQKVGQRYVNESMWSDVSGGPSVSHFKDFQDGGTFDGVVTETGLSIDGDHEYAYTIDYARAAALQRNRNKTTDAEDHVPRS